MGVRGLTTFIAKQANRYLDPHELRDCNLVIDGDNLCAQLYKQVDKGMSAFGGNYDDFFRAVVDFFNLLKQCNVTSYVLLDGGYEMKKMKTTCERLRCRIGVIKYIVPLENFLVFPLMIREVFVSALKYCNVKLYRCLFEADNEIAMLARKLNCPVLSYDSDFYIFDGQYIPYVTITHKVYKKTVKSSESIEVEIMRKRQKGQKSNSKRRGKRVTISVKNTENEQPVDETTYNYLDCCIYTIENLTEGVLESDMLPLFAIMLGNDFISRKWFSKFYRNVSKRKTKKKKNLSPQQKRIHTLLNWLQHETLRSAIKKILECVKQCLRPRLWHQIRTAMSGYRLECCKSYEFFGFEEDSSECEYNNHDIIDMSLEEVLAYESEEEASLSEEECDAEAESDLENANEIAEENEANSESDGFEAKNSEEEDFEQSDGNAEEIEDNIATTYQRKCFEFPEWFLKIYNTASTPRFLVDLLKSRRYINYPQVENFDGNDSNKISYPILNMLYALLHTPNIPRMYYYTRVVKQVRYEVITIESEAFPQVPDYTVSQKRKVNYLKKVFERSFTNVDEIFARVQEIPEAHQLFILAVIYWIKRSSSADIHYLQTVILSLIVINVIDRKCEKIHRDGNVFQKKFSKHLSELKEKEVLVSLDTYENMSIKSIIKNVSKQEAMLCMENFVNHFSISPKFLRKHADFRRYVVHTFSELQSVVYNLYALNPVLNCPFENVKIENYFNGLFLYNMYLNLKARSNSLDYIMTHLLNHSSAMMTIFNRLCGVCFVALPYLQKQISTEPSSISKAHKKAKSKNNNNHLSKAKSEAKIINDCAGNDSQSENEEYSDMNNKFAELLKNF